MNELYASSGAASNRSHFTQRPERSSVDPHDNIRSCAIINRQSGIDAASTEAKVEDLPGNKNAVGWQATDLRETTATESRATAAIIVFAGAFRSVLRHVYKIVGWARMLENGIKVTRDRKPK